MKRLYIVVPCYNEEEILPVSAENLIKKLKSLIDCGLAADNSRVLFVDDGSHDSTAAIIKDICSKTPYAEGVMLAHNSGHQKALVAGLTACRDSADVTVTIDADLQDDVDAIDAMLKHYYDGCDIVYGVRDSRDTDSGFKRNTAGLFYKIMQFLGAEIVPQHADFRLMSHRAVEALLSYQEVNLFLRGIVPSIGYKTEKVYYSRRERMLGETKYPFKKMAELACDGITSFSIKPIRFILAFGILTAFAGFIFIIASIIKSSAVMAILASIWCVGGIIISALGVIGEYIGKTYMEVKHRPKFIIKEHINKS